MLWESRSCQNALPWPKYWVDLTIHTYAIGDTREKSFGVPKQQTKKHTMWGAKFAASARLCSATNWGRLRISERVAWVPVAQRAEANKKSHAVAETGLINARTGRRIAYEINPPSIGIKLTTDWCCAANDSMFFLPSSSVSPNAYWSPLVEKKLRASVNVIHPRSSGGNPDKERASVAVVVSIDLHGTGGSGGVRPK